MTEFEDIDDFMQDLENSEFDAVLRAGATLELEAEALDEREEDITMEDVREEAVRFFNEDVEFTEEDVILTQESGRRII